MQKPLHHEPSCWDRYKIAVGKWDLNPQVFGVLIQKSLPFLDNRQTADPSQRPRQDLNLRHIPILQTGVLNHFTTRPSWTRYMRQTENSIYSLERVVTLRRDP